MMVSVFVLSQMEVALPESLYCASIHHLCLFSVRIQNQNLFFFFQLKFCPFHKIQV